MGRAAICVATLALAFAAHAELCKYIDSTGSAHFASAPPEPTWRLVECYGDGKSLPLPSSRPAIVGVGRPSILPQCLDPGPLTVGVGPSARARECTRQYCERPEYRAKVAAYAMNGRQSESDQSDALTCITRSEQDQTKR